MYLPPSPKFSVEHRIIAVLCSGDSHAESYDLQPEEVS